MPDVHLQCLGRIRRDVSSGRQRAPIRKASFQPPGALPALKILPLRMLEPTEPSAADVSPRTNERDLLDEGASPLLDDPNVALEAASASSRVPSRIVENISELSAPLVVGETVEVMRCPRFSAHRTA